MYTHILVRVVLDPAHPPDESIKVADKLLADGGRVSLLHVMEEIPAYIATQIPKNILKAEDTVGSLSEMGVMFSTTKGNEAAAQLLTLEGDDGDEHWVGFHNFFVITRYNRSVMYALAVHQLGQEIALVVRGDAS